ncbi:MULTISPECIES: single-stranded DNA-binding protein [unclassified Modicisalibacter]|uniref:single-stranded DNA-binding protein n=1 Tax=unclassified Modicisalibacter TaxID=2679913 RepID=UPI001CCEE1AE|nr:MULTISPECIES: single-stranded DNA-binding protein [unclassified Modicisalibacter]MBZ9559043.1 single-stranded DNA-binding protein [Modicisalibacter sp. R2A 31.J]MBZ9576846.1 single-stranded DNA-binding protein [Modicisalibacter sp. MOD 31.J]
MSTHFSGEGNIGSDPEVRMFPPSGNQAPRGVLRLNVRFDNPVPTEQGNVDRGGFWANVEIWNRDVETWARLYQRGMRVMVSGRMVLDEWKDRESGEDRSQFKVQAQRVGILPFRVTQVVLEKANCGANQQSITATDEGSVGAFAKTAGEAGEWNNPVGSNSVAEHFGQ